MSIRKLISRLVRSPSTRRREKLQSWCAAHLEQELAAAGFMIADEEAGVWGNVRVYVREPSAGRRAYVLVGVHPGIREDPASIQVVIGEGGWRDLEHWYSGVPLPRYVGRPADDTVVSRDMSHYLVPYRDLFNAGATRLICEDLFTGARCFLAGDLAPFRTIRSSINMSRPDWASFSVRRAANGEVRMEPVDTTGDPFFDRQRQWRQEYSA